MRPKSIKEAAFFVMAAFCHLVAQKKSGCLLFASIFYLLHSGGGYYKPG